MKWILTDLRRRFKYLVYGRTGTTYMRKVPSGIVIWARYLFNRRIKGLRVSKPPVFIVGCGHSGTTLLREVLGAHSNLYDIPYETNVCFARKPHWHLASFDRLAISEGRPRWVEKTPRHIRSIPKLFEFRPEARILIMLRDGRDVACSFKARDGDLETGIRRWVDDNVAGEKYWDHPNVHLLKYEDLIEDFEGTISAALEFIGEEYEPSIKEFHLAKQAKKLSKPETVSGENHNRLRRWQVSQPLFDGRGRWKQMTDEDKRIVVELAGEMLVRYGYADKEWCGTESALVPSGEPQ